jgi:hypothetical protein
MGIGAGQAEAADPLKRVGLDRLMALTRGLPDMVVGLIAEPVAIDQVALLASICPECAVRPRLVAAATPWSVPGLSPATLAAAIDDCLDAGARIVTITATLPSHLAGTGSPVVTAALDRAARRGALVLVACPDGASAVARHPWVVPVVPAPERLDGLPSPGPVQPGPRLCRRGLSAPATAAGTAVALVAGASALLWSATPCASVDALRHALVASASGPRTTDVPLIDAWSAHIALRAQALHER